MKGNVMMEAPLRIYIIICAVGGSALQNVR